MPDDLTRLCRRVVLLCALALSAIAAKESAPPTAETLLRLAEAPALLENSPEQLILQLEPILQRPANDSLAWVASWWLLHAWDRLGFPEEIYLQTKEWFELLTHAPWNGVEHLRQIARWKIRFELEPQSIRQEAPADSSGERLFVQGSFVWLQQGNNLISLSNQEAARRIPEGSIARFAGSDWIISQSLARPQLHYWIRGDQQISEIFLPEDAVWKMVLDDGRIVSAGKNWIQMQRGSQLLLRNTQSGLELCRPSADPHHPWVLLLDCPGDQRHLIDLANGAPLLVEQNNTHSLKRFFTSQGELRMTAAGIELLSSPEGKLIWRQKIDNIRDITHHSDRVFVRSGDDTLMIFDLRSRRMIGKRGGIPGLLFSGSSGVGTYTSGGTFLFLRRDGSLKSLYYAGQSIVQSPVESDNQLLTLLTNGQLLSLNPNIDEALIPTKTRALFEEWKQNKDPARLRELLLEEPGEPSAWRELARLESERKTEPDSAIAYWERSLRNRLPSPRDREEIEEWRELWGVRWILRVAEETPFRTPVLLAGEKLAYAEESQGALTLIDTKQKTTEQKFDLPTGITQLMSHANQLFAVTEDRRLFKIGSSSKSPSAEWRSREELLFATLDGGSPFLLSATEDSLIIRRFNEELHSSVIQKIKRDGIYPTQFIASGKNWAIGYPNGKLQGGSTSPGGQYEWEISLGQELVRLNIMGDTLVAGTSKSRLLFLEMKSGRMIGRLEASSGDAGAPVLISHNDRMLLTQFENGLIVTLNQDDASKSARLKEYPGWNISWATPLWWKKSLILPQPEALWLVRPDNFHRQKLSFLPSPPSSCLIAKEELICALEGGWLVGFPLPSAELNGPIDVVPEII